MLQRTPGRTRKRRRKSRNTKFFKFLQRAAKTIKKYTGASRKRVTHTAAERLRDKGRHEQKKNTTTNTRTKVHEQEQLHEKEQQHEHEQQQLLKCMLLHNIDYLP